MTCPALHRIACHLHTLRRSRERGLGLGVVAIAGLEAVAEGLRPAYERTGRTRYRLAVPRRRLVIVYDTRLRCLVTVWPISWGLCQERRVG